jgi:hypothetical protein
MKESGRDENRHPLPLDYKNLSHADILLIMPYWRAPWITEMHEQMSKLKEIARNCIL